ncbi:MAG: hypothetical protein B6D39_01640 [Anaerolineae bacterium UTCFX2]|jgi:hypothetical protein|nr:hypothetical protein [Anaerolineae bacterium]MCZ7552663.1 hypothetical protein [Anaerolineales bacterium]OQY94207.1 MAG: hypothetical protein B6D39_01640 [Anaerolineae bacterium UTCFX2]
MNLFKKISDWFSSASRPEDPGYWISVKCNRCREKIRARIDLRNDLSIEYGGAQDARPTFFTRKLLVGESGRCFQRIEVELTFDADKHLLSREIQGGTFDDEQPA